MKFTCERCGKRFSSVDEPMPGRVYRIRCRCGNTIEIAAPRVVPDAVPHAKGGMPLGPAGASAATVRSATPAGDAPVRAEKTPPGTPAPRHAAPARSAPPGATPAPSIDPEPTRGSTTAPMGSTGRTTSTAHPLATPDLSLVADPWAAAPQPGAASRRGSTSASMPVPGGSPPSPRDAAPRRPPERAAWPDAPFSSELPPELDLGNDAPLPAAPEPPAPKRDEVPDPFAAAAAHAARFDPFDFPVPSAGSPRTPAAASPPPARAPARAPATRVAEPSRPAIPRPPPPVVGPPGAAVHEELPSAAGADEDSVELSQSEQYELPHITRHDRPRGREGGKGKIVLAIGGSAALGLAAAVGAWWFLQRRAEAPPVTVVVAPAPVPKPPTPTPTATATPTATPTEAAAATATATPAEAALPPPTATPLAEPTPTAEPKPATRTTAAADRRAAKKAEAERLAAERKVEADRKAAEKQAQAERKAAEKKAEAERLAAARQADADRREAEKRAAAERKAEADRRAEAERKAAADRKAVAAQDAAMQEALRKKEPVAEKAPEPLADGLDPATMQGVLRANRPVLEGCVQRALEDPATSSYAGRKVYLMILVGSNGRADGALEDDVLEAAAFGTCIRRAVSGMKFPAFRGEPVGARIPLQLGKAE